VASPTKNPIMKVTVDVKNAQATEKTRGSDMVAEGMMEVQTEYATSTPVMETSQMKLARKWGHVMYFAGVGHPFFFIVSSKPHPLYRSDFSLANDFQSANKGAALDRCYHFCGLSGFCSFFNTGYTIHFIPSDGLSSKIWHNGAYAIHPGNQSLRVYFRNLKSPSAPE